MVAPRPTPTEQEEDLFTTVAPTIREDDDGDIEPESPTPDLNIDDFEEVTYVHTTFPDSENTTKTSETESDQDDHSVIEISTIQPDVPMPDASHSTEPMFAEGKTEETIVASAITTDMTSEPANITATSVEVTSERVFPEATSSVELPSTTAAPFDEPDEIETAFQVEAEPPTLPPLQILTSVPSQSTADRTVTHISIPSGITQPDSKVTESTTPAKTVTTTLRQTTPPIQSQDTKTSAVAPKVEATTSPIITDSKASVEDLSTTSIHVFDESTTQVQDPSGDSGKEEDITTEIGTEFIRSSQMASTAAPQTTSTPTVVTQEQSTQVTVGLQRQNYSGKAIFNITFLLKGIL